MYRLTLSLVLVSLLALASCGSKQPEKSITSEAPSSEEAKPELSEDVPDVVPLEVKKFEKEVGENELEIEYPVSGNPELVQSIRNWLNEQLSDTFHGDMDDAEAFFRHYASQLGNDPDINEYGGYSIDKFDVEYQNDLLVTYDYTSYLYEGGAHGMGGSYGTTFLKADGSIFDKDCIRSYRDLHQLFIDGLKKYFKVKTDSELAACLLNVTDLGKLNPPGMKPWIEEDGVVFSYTPYEIAPYSSGSPNFTIPFDKIKPYLTEKGLRFFQP